MFCNGHVNHMSRIHLSCIFLAEGKKPQEQAGSKVSCSNMGKLQQGRNLVPDAVTDCNGFATKYLKNDSLIYDYAHFSNYLPL